MALSWCCTVMSMWWLCRDKEAANAEAVEEVGLPDIDADVFSSDDEAFASAHSTPEVSDDEACDQAQPDAAAAGACNPVFSCVENAELLDQEEEEVRQLLHDSGWAFGAAGCDADNVGSAAAQAAADDLQEWYELSECVHRLHPAASLIAA